MSKALMDRTEPASLTEDWDKEVAPSRLRPEEPRLARWVGSMGLMLVALAGFSILFQAISGASRIGPGWQVFLFAVGLAGMLFHATRDPDLQIRRTYGVLGVLFLIGAIVLSFLPFHGTAGALFMPYGILCLPLALLFLLAFAHNETEASWHRMAVAIVGFSALVLAGTGFIGSNVSANFLLPYGLLLSLIGLAYWWSFAGMLGTNHPSGYRAGLAMGAVGVIVFLVALGRSVIPALAQHFGWVEHHAEESYLASAGLLLMSLGIMYAGLSAGLCSDNRLVVLTRRELAAFFYSPIAYIVLFGITFVGMCLFWLFVNTLIIATQRGVPLFEPIIQYYIIAIVPVISVIIVVPILTMRLLSEEKRTGTLEVLLTAPLDETSVVLSKFIASWIFFMILWIPWGLFLIGLRVEVAQPFDWRPLLSFFIALGCSGAGFLSMGLFFSSLTRNQIGAAILTFMGMTVLLSIFFVIQSVPATTTWKPLLTHASFINLWQSSLEGKLIPRDVLFPLSATVFWLFLTVKMLEARRWS